MATLSYDEAAHLLRRAGFGGTPEEIDNLSSRGREGAVDFLINFGQIDNSEMDSLLAASFDFSNPQNNQTFNQNEIRRWWFTRMVTTKRQFEEKLTLFWHNHFATSINKVSENNGLFMFNQNKLLRDNSLARFDDLLLKVAQDPAMLIWLDGLTNVLGKPNENFGRELQELFTMGINDVVTGQQNYTEDDVKQIARAFTGWDYQRTSPFTFRINANQHDNGTKTIYGQPGNFSGQDVITMISARPAAARYLTWKLFNFFVYPVTDADKSTIDRFAKVYLNNDHSIKELVRAILTSDDFFSDRAFFSLVKQPVEFVVSAVRMLGGTYNPGSTISTPARTSTTPQTTSRNMGQDLFAPPDVSGWDFNLGWVNTASMLERFNFANAYLTNRNTTVPGVFVTNDQLKSIAKASSKKTVKKFLARLGPLSVGDALGTLRTYLETGDNGQPVTYVNDDATIDKKIRGLVHQITCLPEFQLN